MIGDGDDYNDALREARIPLVELVDGVEGKASLKMNTAEDVQYKKLVKALQGEIGYDIVKERVVHIATSFDGRQKNVAIKSNRSFQSAITGIHRLGESWMRLHVASRIVLYICTAFDTIANLGTTRQINEYSL